MGAGFHAASRVTCQKPAAQPDCVYLRGPVSDRKWSCVGAVGGLMGRSRGSCFGGGSTKSQCSSGPPRYLGTLSSPCLKPEPSASSPHPAPSGKQPPPTDTLPKYNTVKSPPRPMKSVTYFSASSLHMQSFTLHHLRTRRPFCCEPVKLFLSWISTGFGGRSSHRSAAFPERIAASSTSRCRWRS